MRIQFVKGLPEYPGKQEQDGAWLMTLHSALRPHVPGQGSRHLLLTQALLRSQSELMTHSGLQPVYGSPKYSGRQTQEPAPLRSLHTAFAPHGDGLQGSRGPSVGGTGRHSPKLKVPYKTKFEEKKLYPKRFLLSNICEHPAKGSPVNPGSQVH